jgi:hypothetical protein
VQSFILGGFETNIYQRVANQMPGIKKFILIVLLSAIAFVGFIVGDWYRFVKYAELDPKRGVYGNNHLEVWIDLNQMMPAPVKTWGCKILLDREEKVLGFRPARQPYGCNPELENMPVIDAYMMSYTANAEYELRRKNATPAQKDGAITCLKADLMAAMTPEQQEALKAGQDANAIIAISTLAQKVIADCIAKAGL